MLLDYPYIIPSQWLCLFVRTFRQVDTLELILMSAHHPFPYDDDIRDLENPNNIISIGTTYNK